MTFESFISSYFPEHIISDMIESESGVISFDETRVRLIDDPGLKKLGTFHTCSDSPCFSVLSEYYTYFNESNDDIIAIIQKVRGKPVVLFLSQLSIVPFTIRMRDFLIQKLECIELECKLGKITKAQSDEIIKRGSFYSRINEYYDFVWRKP